MKKIIFIIVLIFVALNLFSTPADSLKISNLEKQLQAEKARNQAVENAFVQVYLSKTGKSLGPAFMDFYLENIELAKSNKLAIQILKEFKEAETVKKRDEIIDKYNLNEILR